MNAYSQRLTLNSIVSTFKCMSDKTGRVPDLLKQRFRREVIVDKIVIAMCRSGDSHSACSRALLPCMYIEDAEDCLQEPAQRLTAGRRREQVGLTLPARPAGRGERSKGLIGRICTKLLSKTRSLV